MEAKDVYNQVEPFIWYGVAVLSVPALRHHARLPTRLGLAALVALFGTSDFFEREAWWTPWWLLAWKAACLVGMAAVIGRIWLKSRRPSRGVDSSGGDSV